MRRGQMESSLLLKVIVTVSVLAVIVIIFYAFYRGQGSAAAGLAAMFEKIAAPFKSVFGG